MGEDANFTRFNVPLTTIVKTGEDDTRFDQRFW